MIMNMKPLVVKNIALMVLFGVTGLSMFTENVRTVQIIGLLACGAGFGAALTMIISSFRSKQKKT
jgi:hypothetical protein